ncbi:hypothetical protein GCM10020256_69040 [Streptomyces thermocoprophilus]
MLAIASLATGFVVAAVTPSHGLAAPDTPLDGLNVGDTLSALDHTVADESLDMDKNAVLDGD